MLLIPQLLIKMHPETLERNTHYLLSNYFIFNHNIILFILIKYLLFINQHL